MPDFHPPNLPLPLPIALAASARGLRRPHGMRRLRRASGRHPEWWILPVSAAAWGWMWMGTPPAVHGQPGPGIVPTAFAMGMMIVAMMFPLTIGQLRALARSTPWRGRHLRIAAFVTGYLALWMVAMGVIHAAWNVSAAITSPAVALAIAAAAAALWEVVPAKRRLHGCGGAQVAAARGWRGCAMDGVAAGGRCAGSCWALMAVCVAFAHSVPAMAALFALQLNGRFRRALPPAAAALAIVALWLASLTAGAGGGHHH